MNGGDLYELARILGHAKHPVTERYTPAYENEPRKKHAASASTSRGV